MSSTTEARTPLDELWHQFLWSALASDGPIRDSDVKDAVKWWRPKIEAEVARLDVDRLAAAIGDTWLPDGEMSSLRYIASEIAAEYARLSTPPPDEADPS